MCLLTQYLPTILKINFPACCRPIPVVTEGSGFRGLPVVPGAPWYLSFAQRCLGRLHGRPTSQGHLYLRRHRRLRLSALLGWPKLSAFAACGPLGEDGFDPPSPTPQHGRPGLLWEATGHLQLLLGARVVPAFAGVWKRCGKSARNSPESR